jgi:hypothetical protein
MWQKLDSEGTPDPIVQIGTEWYKLLYDFYKHFMTVALASIAAVGALLGGPFRDAIGPGAGWLPQALTVITFVAFIITLLSTVEGMHLARSKVLGMHEVTTFKQFEKHRKTPGPKYPRVPPTVIWSTVWSSYVVGIVAFILLLFTSAFGYGIRENFYVIVILVITLFLYIDIFAYSAEDVLPRIQRLVEQLKQKMATDTSSTNFIRWGGLAAMVAGLLYFVGYAGMADLLMPVMSNLGGHVVLGLAGLATLLALVGVLKRDALHSALLGAAGYALSFIGAVVFSVGNLAEGLLLVEFGVVLFRVGLMILTAGVMLLGFSVRRAKVLPAWAVWPLFVGWAAFLPVANRLAVFGFADFGLSLLAAGMLGIGWVAVGYALWAGRGTAARSRIS